MVFPTWYVQCISVIAYVNSWMLQYYSDVQNVLLKHLSDQDVQKWITEISFKKTSENLAEVPHKQNLLFVCILVPLFLILFVLLKKTPQKQPFENTSCTYFC